MNAVFKASIVIVALCSQAGAQDPNPPPQTTDEFKAVCWYEMLAELCQFPITARQRPALESVRKKIRAESVDGEELTANVMCSSFQDDAKRGIEHVCTALTREHTDKVLNALADREESPPK